MRAPSLLYVLLCATAYGESTVVDWESLSRSRFARIAENLFQAPLLIVESLLNTLQTPDWGLTLPTAVYEFTRIGGGLAQNIDNAAQLVNLRGAASHIVDQLLDTVSAASLTDSSSSASSSSSSSRVGKYKSMSLEELQLVFKNSPYPVTPSRIPQGILRGTLLSLPGLVGQVSSIMQPVISAVDAVSSPPIGSSSILGSTTSLFQTGGGYSAFDSAVSSASAVLGNGLGLSDAVGVLTDTTMTNLYGSSWRGKMAMETWCKGKPVYWYQNLYSVNAVYNFYANTQLDGTRQLAMFPGTMYVGKLDSIPGVKLDDKNVYVFDYTPTLSECSGPRGDITLGSSANLSTFTSIIDQVREVEDGLYLSFVHNKASGALEQIYVLEAEAYVGGYPATNLVPSEAQPPGEEEVGVAPE